MLQGKMLQTEDSGSAKTFYRVAWCVGETESRLKWSRVSIGGVGGNDI